MKYLNTNQVLIIHDEVVKQTGGSSGVRDINLLESAVARPRATFSGEDLYPDLFAKVFALGHSLILNHPFVDGNKRTGYMAMRLFLNINGYDIKASAKDRFDFVMNIATKKLDEKSMASWLKNHSNK
ncbi:MAG: type II toxin-antitoxin system death-on-curing family toxin [bacterium]